MRTAFARVTDDLLDADPRTAVVLADISTDLFAAAAARHPRRVLNVGIREQLMVGVAGGLALTGMRPVVHSYATFTVDRAYEQLKLDLGHQGVGAVVVSVGASYDAASAGYTHFSPMDVALLDTLDDWTVHVPGHADEVEPLLRSAVAGTGRVYLRLSEREQPVRAVGQGVGHDAARRPLEVRLDEHDVTRGQLPQPGGVEGPRGGGVGDRHVQIRGGLEDGVERGSDRDHEGRRR